MAFTTIDDPTIFFTAFKWTGNGASSRALTGVGFQGDMLWSKPNTGHNHYLVDRVRGVDNKSLIPDATTAEDTNGTHGHFDSIDSDGFTGTLAGGGYNFNRDALEFIAWIWKAGGSASSNSNGSIASSVSSNTTSGFSIVSYTGNNTDGATVGHGLGVIPSMVITKSRSAASLTGWMTKHKDLTSNYNVILNGTDAAWNPSSNGWVGDLNNTATFSLENGGTNGNNANQDTITYIAYCFAEKQGYSKFGSYIANANADGAFVYTGFKPAFLLIKNTSQATDWIMYDNKRDGFEPQNKEFRANTTAAERNAEDNNVQFCANGFKLRNAGTKSNADAGNILIYMAFAENPLVTSTGIPATAR